MGSALILALLLALSGLLGPVTGAEAADAAQEQPPPIDGPVNDHGQARVTGNKIAVELDDFYFAPTYIATSRGATFTAQLHNEGSVSHTFTIDELGIDEVLRPGQRRSVQVTMPDRTQLIFVCTFHGARGMRGEFYT